MPEFLAQSPPRLALGGRVSFPISLALHVAVAALLVILPGDGEDEQIKRERPGEVVLLTAPPPELYRAPPAEPKLTPTATPEPSGPSSIEPPAAPPPKPAPEQPERLRPRRAQLEIEPSQAPRARAVSASSNDAPRPNESDPAQGLVVNLEPQPAIVQPRLVVQEAGFAGFAAERELEGRGAPLLTGLFGSAEAASGSGRERPAGKIVTAGFGKVEPTENRKAHARAVHDGGFAAAAVIRPAPKPSATPPKASSTQPVRVLSKPTPAYTEQARALRIEGEATIEALFRADGIVEVLRVVRGLGHGLDESAAVAALAIRFEPAREDGKPVDSVVQIRIRFEMAY